MGKRTGEREKGGASIKKGEALHPSVLPLKQPRPPPPPVSVPVDRAGTTPTRNGTERGVVVVEPNPRSALPFRCSSHTTPRRHHATTRRPCPCPPPPCPCLPRASYI